MHATCCAGTDFEHAVGTIRFEHNEGLKTIDVRLGSAPRPETTFHVFLAPDPQQPTVNGHAYVSKRRGLCRVNIVTDDNIAKVCAMLAAKPSSCFLSMRAAGRAWRQ
jgi:hypothetical protein